MRQATPNAGYRALVEGARTEIERKLKSTVIKAVAHIRRRSIIVGFELAPRGNTANPIAVAAKLPRPDPAIPEFDQPSDRAEVIVMREYAALSAMSRLHAAQAASLSAVGVPIPRLKLENPVGLVMSFVGGHALRDILAGKYPERLPAIAARADEKAAGLVALLSKFAAASVDTATRDASAEIALAERILIWLADPARRAVFDNDPSVIAARLKKVVGSYKPAPTQLRHGDLKGCNLMLDGDGHLFLVDFEDVSRGDPNLDVADLLFALRIDSSLSPLGVATADLFAAELVRAWKRRHAISPETLAFPMFLQAACHAGRQLDAAIRDPESGLSLRRVAACLPWLTGQRETLDWLDRIFTTAETVTH